MGHDDIHVNGFCPPYPLWRGPHFGMNRPVSNGAIYPQSVQAHRMLCLHCDIAELLEASRPPDPELVDLIEQAFLEGQIDSRKSELAYLCLLPVLTTKAGTFAGTRGN